MTTIPVIPIIPIRNIQMFSGHHKELTVVIDVDGTLYSHREALIKLFKKAIKDLQKIGVCGHIGIKFDDNTTLWFE